MLTPEIIQESPLPRDRIHPPDQAIAKSYVAKAVPNGHGSYFAIWAAPGMRPDYIYAEDEPEVFSDEWQAEAKARQVLFEALNSRPAQRPRAYLPNTPGPQRDVLFKKMTAAEFAAGIAEAGVTVQELAFIWGTNPQRIDNMRKGIDAVPFPLRWILPLLANDEILSAAMDAAEAHTEIRQRK